MKTFWTTFYSYKGGVGRSLALANIAALLVKKGRRVVLIDFDLEAPGLDSFCEFSPVKANPGVIEYTSQFIADRRAPDITQFVHECPLAAAPRGKLWIMPAGRKDAAYNRYLHEIDWIKLYDEGLGAPFVENWKAAIENTYKPDFVLIDSRTGITEIGGICTMQFPDLVVMLFSLNDQNIRGIHAVTKTLTGLKEDCLPQVVYVATPIPDMVLDEKGLLQKRLEVAQEILGAPIEYFIRYFPEAALEEKLYALSELLTESSLVIDYERLEQRIIELNQLGLDFVVKQSANAIESGNVDRIQGLLNLLNRDFAQEPEAMFQQAALLKELGEMDQAVVYAEKAFNADPTFELPFNFLESFYKRHKKPLKIASLYKEMLSKNISLGHDERSPAFIRMGEYLMQSELFQDAHYAYEQAMLEFVQSSEQDSELELAISFNIAESRRRATKIVYSMEWTNIIAIFERKDCFSDSLENQANHQQAMHIAYALSGERATAMDCLKKAAQIVAGFNDAGVFFTPKYYRHVTKDEFLSINEEMLLALGSGKLWDGTPLPGNDLATDARR